MAVPVFCNSCGAHPRKPTPRFCLTSCGHVLCEVCLPKGKKDECLICKTACQTLVLSKQTNPDIQALFMGVDVLCNKYSKEITQISEFQEKHRKHLLSYYKQKAAKLEESLKKVTQQMQQIQWYFGALPRVLPRASPSMHYGHIPPVHCSCQSMKPPEKTPQLPFSSISRNSLSMSSRKQNGYSSYPPHSSHPSTSEMMVESMEIDSVPSPMRRLETPSGPSRLSVITPPQDGRMGSVAYKNSQSSLIMSSQNIGAGSTRSTPIRLPLSGCPSSAGSQSSRRGLWGNSDFRTPQLYPFASPSPQHSATRHPITLSGLLQRQQLGPTNFGGHSAER